MKTLWFFLFISIAVQSQKNYEKLKSSVLEKREDFSCKYESADETGKESLRKEAENYLVKLITKDLFSAWYGTPWDFNGTTETPKKGSIACGYFVTTVLRDAGFRIPRIKWAQSASEPVIMKIATQIRRFHNAPLNKVEQYLAANGDGLYIVGLDNHVGFIFRKNKVNLFIHSSYYKPEIGVMAELLDTDNPLKHSSYRVIGKLLSDKMITYWLTGTQLE